MADLLVGFDLASGLVAKHLLHEIELLHQMAHVGVLNELGVGGLTLHLVLVDGFHCCWQAMDGTATACQKGIEMNCWTRCRFAIHSR